MPASGTSAKVKFHWTFNKIQIDQSLTLVTTGLQVINGQFLCAEYAKKSLFGSQALSNFGINSSPFDRPNEMRSSSSSNGNVVQTGFANGSVTPTKFQTGFANATIATKGERKQATPKSQKKRLY